MVALTKTEAAARAAAGVGMAAAASTSSRRPPRGAAAAAATAASSAAPSQKAYRAVQGMTGDDALRKYREECSYSKSRLARTDRRELLRQLLAPGLGLTQPGAEVETAHKPGGGGCGDRDEAQDPPKTAVAVEDVLTETAHKPAFSRRPTPMPALHPVRPPLLQVTAVALPPPRRHPTPSRTLPSSTPHHGRVLGRAPAPVTGTTPARTPGLADQWRGRGVPSPPQGPSRH